MKDSPVGPSLSIGKLILVPAVITLAVTILRLVGELENWSPVFFNKHAGGGGALIGISWLPIIFGPYFAWKLATAGDRPANTGKALGAILAGLAVFVAGGLAFFVSLRNPRSPNVLMMLLGVVLWIGSGFIARMAWRGLGSTLFAYAFAARIPVLIVMYLAMSANGGQGWGTHYDAAGPGFPSGTPLATKFLELAVVPQMTLWIGWTVVAGALFGWLVVVLLRRRSAPAPAWTEVRQSLYS